jgi:hypothetical protein
MRYIICTCAYFWFIAVCLTVDDAKELRLSENCEQYIMLSASRNANKCARYSNTLLVSLNNRIYFREHQPPGNGDCTCLAVSDRVRAPEMSSPNFAIPEPQTQASKDSDVIFPLDPVSQIGNLNHSTTDLSPVRAIYFDPNVSEQLTFAPATSQYILYAPGRS